VRLAKKMEITDEARRTGLSLHIKAAVLDLLHDLVGCEALRGVAGDGELGESR
jgi:hypothetical protein